jgi:hypothetical protein
MPNPRTATITVTENDDDFSIALEFGGGSYDKESFAHLVAGHMVQSFNEFSAEHGVKPMHKMVRNQDGTTEYVDANGIVTCDLH